MGAGNDSDHAILLWAHERGYVIVTHDLNFGAILAATQMLAPSVVQIRTQDISPERSAGLLLNTLEVFGDMLATGALISVDAENARVRLLPIR